MSGGTVLRSAIRSVAGLELDAESARLASAVLRAVRTGPQQLLYDAARQAGLDHTAAVERAMPCLLAFATANLSDDLSDEECSYLAAPARDGPCLVVLFSSLYHRELTALDLGPHRTKHVHEFELEMGAAQLLGLVSTEWDAVIARRVVRGIAGAQWAAYLSILWAGTPLEAEAVNLGYAFGTSFLISEDATTGDPRFSRLAVNGRQQLLADARAALQHVERAPVNSIRTMAPAIRAGLEMAADVDALR